MPADTELCFTPARKLAQMIRSRKVSATELTRAFIAQIERVNPKVNAIVTFLPDEAIKAAKAMDRKKGRQGILAGLPIAFKDLVPTKGVRTTFGSPVFEHNVPQEDHALVERLRAARRDHDRQDQHAGVRRGQPDLQQGVRRDAQSLRSRQDLRRLVRRRGRGRRLRHAALRRRIRPRREPAQSRQLLQRRRVPARRPGACRRGPPPTRGTRSRCWGRWRAPFPTARCSSARWPARIRARPRRSTSRARHSSGRCAGISGRSASPGAAISAGCRWIRA